MPTTIVPSSPGELTAEEPTPPEARELKLLRMRVIARTLRERREALKLTQEEIATGASARGAHVSTGHIARLESAKRITQFDDIGYFRLGAVLAELHMTHADLETEILKALYGGGEVLERLAEEARLLSGLYASLPQEERDLLTEYAESLARRVSRRGPVRVIATGWSAADIAAQRQGLARLDEELRAADDRSRGRRVRKPTRPSHAG